MINKEQVVPGTYFKFRGGDRRVIKVENGQVQWVYADGVKRFGQNGGSQRLKHFANEAVDEYDSKETHKAIVKDGFRSALNPRTKAEKIVVLISYVFALGLMLIFVRTIERWIF